VRDVILHAFDWPWATIAARAPGIAAAGYGAVLCPPPLYSDEAGAAWWQRYQPKDYRVLRSHLGRRRDVEAAIAALHAHGVRALADLVLNHMANEKALRLSRGEADLYAYPGAVELARYRRERAAFEEDRLYGNLGDGLFSARDFNPEGDIAFHEWSDPAKVQEKWLGGLPDLDMNDWVVDQQVTLVRALCALGFDGFRVDAMKHLPVEHMLRVLTIDALDARLVFGEVLTFDDRDEAAFLWPIVRHTRFPCYDFALYETLRRAFSPAGSLRELVDPAAFGQALPWWRAITFAVTHDLPNNPGFRGLLLDRQDEHLALAYLLGRDGGVPLVYSDSNESAAAHPEDRDRWAGAWNRPDVAGMIRFHDAVHGLAQRSLFEADGFLVLARGDRGIVAVNKTEAWQAPAVWTWGLRHGAYRCQLHGHVMQVSGDTFTFAIPPRTAQLWLAEGA
jgi:alpha-amylase